MPQLLKLHLTPGPAGGLAIGLAIGQTRDARGQLFADQMEEIQRRLTGIRAAVPAMIKLGGHPKLADAELAFGRALSAVLTANVVVRDQAVAGRQRAEDRGDELVLLIDAEDAPGAEDRRLQRLPWELIAWRADGAHAEAQRSVQVARLLEGPPARELPAKAGLRVLCWAPDAATDTTISALLQRDLELWQRLGVPVHVLPDGLAPLPPPAPERADVLHILCHGRSALGKVRMLAGEGEWASHTAAHLFAALAPTLRLVVLDVCESGQATQDGIDNPAAALLRGGAPAVLAPWARSDWRVSAKLAEGLYGALLNGCSLSGATWEARRAVLGHGDPHPDGRWYNYRLHVADGSVLTGEPPVDPRWRPEGWPLPGPDALTLLGQARRVAAARGAGYVGVEHLLRALRAHPSPGPMGVALLDALGVQLEDRLKALDRLQSVRQGVEDLRGTPRLRRYAEALHPGFGMEVLLGLLVSDPRSPVRVLLKTTLGEEAALQRSEFILTTSSSKDLIDEIEPEPVAAPARALEVVGGPEDGLRFEPAPGQVLGRWDPRGERAADVVLYERAIRVDPKLHRHHLRWHSTGVFQALGGGRVRRGLREDPFVEGDTIEVGSGDLVALGLSTHLMGID